MALETVSSALGVLGFLVSPAKQALLATLPDERKSGVIETVRDFLTSEPQKIDNRVKNIQEESWRSALDYYKDVVIFLKNKFPLDAKPTQQAREDLKRKLRRAEAKAIEAMNMGNKLEKNAGGFPLIEAFYIRVFCVMLIELLGTDPKNISASVKFIVETWKDDVHSKLYCRSSVQQCLYNNLNPGVVQNLLPLNQKKEAFEQIKSLLSVMLKWTADLARTVKGNRELLALIADFVENIDKPQMEGMRECDRFLRKQVIAVLEAHPLSGRRAKLSISSDPAAPNQGVLITGGIGSKNETKLYSLASHSTRELNMRLMERRCGHVSGVLRDGRVMVTGGKGPGGVLSSSELIDLQSYKVTPGPPLNEARFVAASAVLNGDFYVSGGMDEKENSLSSCEVFRNGKWMSISDMKVAKKYHSMVAVDKYIYAIGGWAQDNKCLDSVERYCPETDAWETMAHSIQKRSSAGAAELDGCIYLCGGIDEQGFLCSCERYDQIANRWQRVADMNTIHFGHGFHLVSVGGKLYAVDHPVVECYDVRENKWVTVAERMEKLGKIGGSAVVVPYC